MIIPRRFHSIAIIPLLLITMVVNGSSNCLAMHNGVHSSIDESLPRHLPDDVANRFCDLMVLYNGRICPLHTLASDFTLKLTGSSSYHGLSAEQVFTGWIFHFTSWRNEKMIKLKSGAVCNYLGIVDNDCASFADFFDFAGEYRLAAIMNDIRNDKAIEGSKGFTDADEKFNIFSMLYSGQLLKVFPLRDNQGMVMWYSAGDNLPIDTETDKWIFMKKSLDYAHELVVKKDYGTLDTLLAKISRFQMSEAAEVMPSSFRVSVECFYNRYHSILVFFIIAIMAGLVSLIVSLYHMAHGRIIPPVCSRLMLLCNILALVYLVSVFAMRWIIGSHIPLSGGFDTLLFLAMLIAAASLLLQHRYKPLLPLGILLCGMAMLAAYIGEKNPQITPLMPVLNSPILNLHVAVIMMSYALFAIIMLNGVASLIMLRLSHSAEAFVAQSALAGRIMLYPAVFLLTAGIFIGAVWANISWGRYWGWDPKEVWALITMLVYSTALHSRSLRFFRAPVFFHWFAIAAFLVVLFTYFGVNMFLGGMHSYSA